MAVYTDVADDELRAFIALYDIGEVLSCKGIAEGVENSNFLITTGRANFILTLYEKRVAPRDLPFFIALMEHLARHGVACPTPLKGRDGIALRELCGRPAAVVTFLAGMWPRRIQPFHCAAVGGALAALHRKPAHPWTIESLARNVGLSRSALAERFMQFVGQPPMHYLTNWRMQLAANQLRSGIESIAAIANLVGYESEAAFSRAFKKAVGVPPSRWRDHRASII